jgi:hypothetical protein
MNRSVAHISFAAVLSLATLMLGGRCPAQIWPPQMKDLQAQKEEIKKVIYRNWKSLKPCIKLFAKNHHDAEFLIVRVEVEPGNTIGSVSTKPSDQEVEECFESAFWTMDFPSFDEEVPYHFKIEISEKDKPEKEPELLKQTEEEKPIIAKKPVEKPEVVQKPEKSVEPALYKAAPSAEALMRSGHAFSIGKDPASTQKLRAFLLGRPSSAALAKKSHSYLAGGWFLGITGALMGVSGSFLLGFGVNEYLADDPGARAAAFTASGACLLAGGILFEIIAAILVRRSWTCLMDAVKAYNAADPNRPVYQAFVVKRPK